MPTAPLQHIATPGIDIGKNSFHLIGMDTHGTIVLRQKLSRGQVEARLANMPSCLIGMEACVGAHHLSRQLLVLGHDVKLIPAQFVKPRHCPRWSGIPRRDGLSSRQVIQFILGAVLRNCFGVP